MKIDHYLIEQVTLHPYMQPQDVVKMLYQAIFGADHLLSDVDWARQYFNKEFIYVKDHGKLLFEQISPDICRVNLSAWKENGIPKEWLFKMFVLTLSENNINDSKYIFMEHFMEIEKMITLGYFCFSVEEWKKYATEYLKDGIRAVHHSEIFRSNASPAYRIISMSFVKLFPLLERMSSFLDNQKTCIIAIDGRAASGKTTIASQLENITGSTTIHIDDFFLPQELRTKSRLSEIGGNVHYERFLEEVIPKLQNPDVFKYNIFDCSIMNYNGLRYVKESSCRIVEGAYSCHPKFEEYMDIKVFSDIEPNEQVERILKRNGTEMKQIFVERWIPLEEEYINFYNIKHMAHIII